MMNCKNHIAKHSHAACSAGTSRQTGGTFLGLILGLIIGLGIAVGVAVVVTKTPVPFLNKSNRQEKPPELTANQISDPNKPLYGNKEPAREAAKDFAKDAEPSPAPGEPAANGNKLPGATPDKPKTGEKNDGKPADGKPDGKPSEVKTADTKDTKDAKGADGKSADGSAKTIPPKVDNADEKWIYYLQAGAFREQSDADSARAKLALTGFEASISERTAESGLLYRVRIGPFNQMETMNRARVKLSDSGMDVAVIRIAK